MASCVTCVPADATLLLLLPHGMSAMAPGLLLMLPPRLPKLECRLLLSLAPDAVAAAADDVSRDSSRALPRGTHPVTGRRETHQAVRSHGVGLWLLEGRDGGGREGGRGRKGGREGGRAIHTYQEADSRLVLRKDDEEEEEEADRSLCGQAGEGRGERREGGRQGRGQAGPGGGLSTRRGACMHAGPMMRGDMCRWYVCLSECLCGLTLSRPRADGCCCCLLFLLRCRCCGSSPRGDGLRLLHARYSIQIQAGQPRVSHRGSQSLLILLRRR